MPCAKRMRKRGPLDRVERGFFGYILYTYMGDEREGGTSLWHCSWELGIHPVTASFDFFGEGGEGKG